MGLARPEGVFLAGFMLVAVLVARNGSGGFVIASRFCIVFLTLGLAYFLWRWQYFAHPLPNPFYKKGAGVLHWHSLRQSILRHYPARAGLTPMVYVVSAADGAGVVTEVIGRDS